ncbi:hypothetical protein [Geomesophilobacter sediminis]|uniref:Uncharacterized protein n=1 Tax=Geomesophilobacter sediminis TaxID=2798584 RepID=A0A8J7SB45_9BACT|nr:hypothetical protein [Geomesophilobacter sediminis]MBJ6727611.1 hypothetical protein [Geomesophilobacter sediminis]
MDYKKTSPLGLGALAAVYLFFLLLSASSYGDPFIFMGRIYSGTTAQAMVIADTILSLYLLLGILKRQLLTWWLLLAYNLIDIGNALVNLALVPAKTIETLAGTPVPEESLRFNTLAATFALILLNLFIYRRRRLFVNRSPYLF